MNDFSAELATIYIVEDDLVLRQSVETLLSSRGYRCEPFDSVEAFSDRPSSIQSPSCILLDFHLAGRDGLSFIESHSQQRNATPVVVLTAHADVPIAVRFMKAGASTLLRKPYQPAELLEAIEKALEWDRQLERQRLQICRYEECYRQLSKRQLSVLQWVLDGIPNRTIAVDLKISERLVEMERAEILRLFQVKNAVELAVVVTEYKKLTDQP